MGADDSVIHITGRLTPAHTLRLASGGLLLLAALVGCGSDEDDGDASDSQRIEIAAVDYADVGMPEDEQRSVGELVQLPPEELMALFAGVAGGPPNIA